MGKAEKYKEFSAMVEVTIKNSTGLTYDEALQAIFLLERKHNTTERFRLHLFIKGGLLPKGEVVK